MRKFNALEGMLSAGTLTESDLVSNRVTPSDFRKMREGTRAWAVGYNDAPSSVGSRKFRYVFVQERATGWMKDVPMATGWNLKDFRDRRSPILLAHQRGGLPVARGGTIQRNKMYEGYASMLGVVEFPAEGLFSQSDLLHDMVAGGLLNCGSVGFNIHKMREPTKEETKQYGLGEYSAMFEKMSLTEYSLCAVGQQPGAGVIYSDEGQNAFAELISSKEYDAEAVQEVRETILMVPSTKTFHSVGQAVAMHEFLNEDRTDLGVSVERMSESFEEATKELSDLGRAVRELSGRVSALETPEVELSADEEQAEVPSFDDFFASL